MYIDSNLKYSCSYAAKTLRDHKDVVSVGIGYRYKGGVKTDKVCIVVGVKKKLKPEELTLARTIRDAFADVKTDIQEYGEIEAQGLTNRVRPIPPGYSVGHYPLVTAGTLGYWVGRVNDPDDAWYILSNNHVLAATNDAKIGDPTIQPGKADSGSAPRDTVGTLDEYVEINFPGGGGGKKKPKSAALWKLWKYPANLVAKLRGCPFRLVVTRPHVVTQPDPNLADAGITKIVDPSLVQTSIPFGVGVLQGVRDLRLGEEVMKVGRTTEFTSGVVDVVGAQVTVNYGSGKQAAFTDQVIIKGTPGPFSRGGDSGSAIVTEEKFLGGLLFAGNDAQNITIANKISHVFSLLQLRLK